MLEQQIQTKILRWLDKESIYNFKVISANRAGVHDVIACVNGIFFTIEVKKVDGVLSKLQAHHAIQILKSGGETVVARDLEAVKNKVNYIREKYGTNTK